MFEAAGLGWIFAFRQFVPSRSSARRKNNGTSCSTRVRKHLITALRKGGTRDWMRSRRGTWIVRRKTARDRFRRVVRRLWEWCRDHRHWPIAVQHRILSAKLRGHDAYYGVIGNASMLTKLRHQARRVWRQWLHRRSQRRRMYWSRFHRLLERFPLPGPVVVQSVYRQTANP